MVLCLEVWLPQSAHKSQPIRRFYDSRWIYVYEAGMSPPGREYCNTILIEIRTLMKVLRKHQSAEALRRGLPYCSYTCIWHGSYMMWYALICYIYTYDHIQHTATTGSTRPWNTAQHAQHAQHLLSSSNIKAPPRVLHVLHVLAL